MEDIFIALVPTDFSRIQIQTTVFLKERKMYVYSVNIICEGRILKKIKLENPDELQYLNPEKIASDYILSKLKTVTKKSKSRTTINKKNAANSIMNEFNL